VGYDDNVLRLPDGTEPAFFDSASPTYFAQAGLGAKARIKRSRQRIVAAIDLYHREYEEQDELSHTGGTARLDFQWRAAERWSGTVFGAYDRRLRDLEDQLQVSEGLRDTRTLGASAKYALTNELSLELAGAYSDIDVEREFDLEVEREDLAVRLARTLADDGVVGFEARRLERTSDEIGSLADFDQVEIGAYWRQALAPTLRLEAAIAHADREPVDSFSEDYQGVIGDLSLTWDIGPRFALRVTGLRDVGNLNDELSDFALIDEYRIEPLFRASNRLEFGLSLGRQERDFEGGAGTRRDRTNRYGGNVLWKFGAASSLGFELEYGDRSSNRANREFEYTMALITFRLGLSP
jgi:hypothetical protein